MQKYFYEHVRPARSLNIQQYIYYIGQYRYNWHKALEILLVMKGRVEVSYGGKTVLMEEDDLMLMDSNVGHATLAREEKSVAMVIHLEPEYLEEYYHPMQEWKFEGHTDTGNRGDALLAEIRGIMAWMMTRAGSKNPLDQITWDQELNHLLALLFQVFTPGHQAETEYARTKKQKDMMEKILQYVEKNYREKLSLNDLSNLCQYNPSYLSVFFRNHVGVNFYDYLTRIRVREATLELSSTENTVLEIAHNHGFPDVKAFHTAFRKTFGKSPMEYRRQVLAENRGKELLEKRTFLPMDDETINRKLTQYQTAVRHDNGNQFSGSKLLREELTEGLKRQVEESGRELDHLRESLEKIQKRAEELSQIL
ncbi:MAG: AraC family transcriptional regulator [Clostridiales bacterium]|nr:AraC family transcriptional regulator [Clostridiales bacterium]